MIGVIGRKVLRYAMDDKGEGIELMAYLAQVLDEEAGVKLIF